MFNLLWNNRKKGLNSESFYIEKTRRTSTILIMFEDLLFLVNLRAHVQGDVFRSTCFGVIARKKFNSESFTICNFAEERQHLKEE